MLKSHGLLEPECSSSLDGDRGQRRERLTERKKLHQLKRDHEQQEGARRKVLRLDEGQDEEYSSGSDTERAGRGKKDKEGAGQNVDIQVRVKVSVKEVSCVMDSVFVRFNQTPTAVWSRSNKLVEHQES